MRSAHCAGVAELERANEILKTSAAFLAQAELNRHSMIVDYIDSHRGRFGVEPVCAVLPRPASL